MRTGILSLVIAGFVTAWAAPAAGQEGEHQEGHHGHAGQNPAAHLEHLKETLGLTDAQAVQVEAIVSDAMERHEAIFEGGHDDAAREQMRALHEETLARLSEVLNEEQRAKLEEMHRKMMERHKEGHAGYGDEGHGAHERHPGDHDNPDADRT